MTEASRAVASEACCSCLLFAETANAIWKKIRRKEVTVEEGQRLVADIGGIAVETVSGIQAGFQTVKPDYQGQY